MDESPCRNGRRVVPRKSLTVQRLSASSTPWSSAHTSSSILNPLILVTPTNLTGPTLLDLPVSVAPLSSTCDRSRSIFAMSDTLAVTEEVVVSACSNCFGDVNMEPRLHGSIQLNFAVVGIPSSAVCIHRRPLSLTNHRHSALSNDTSVSAVSRLIFAYLGCTPRMDSDFGGSWGMAREEG